MDINKMNIHLFRTRDQNYIYDVGTNGILCVSEEVYSYLSDVRKHLRESTDERLNEEIKTIAREGFLSEERIKYIQHPATHQLPELIKNRLNTITLQVTQQCNLRCKYCTYSGSYYNRIHSDKNMSTEIALKGVDYILDHSALSPRIFIGFYGGEPLLRFDLIKEVVEYAKKQDPSKRYHFHMTTNGTLLKKDVVEFLVANDFNLLISLDGPEEVHDANRQFAESEKGSYKVIMKHLQEIKENHPDFYKKQIGFNCVLDGKHNYTAIDKFFNHHEEVKKWRVNSSLVSDRYAKDEKKFEEDFGESYNYRRFLALLAGIGRIPKEAVSKLHRREIEDLGERYFKRKLSESINETDHPGGPCIPGVRKLFMDVKGDFYPCERVSESSTATHIGNVHEGIDVERAQKVLNIGKLTKEQCRQCWAYRFCNMCVAHVDDLDSLSPALKLSRCQETREFVESKLRSYCTLREFNCQFEQTS